MKIYSEEYFLNKVLECTKEELEEAKGQKMLCQVMELPKKKGTRTIVSMEGCPKLQKLQRNLCHNFLDLLPVSPAAKGFRKDSSYVDFLEEHTGSQCFLRMDIRNFFDSISIERFREFLGEYVEDEKNGMNIRGEILELCTWNERIPQGYISSPVISNLVFRRIDQRIRKYCRAYYKERNREIFYTRYADDLLFSSWTGLLEEFDFRKNKNFKAMIDCILKENGFACNESKTIYQKGEISLSGYVVGEDVHLSRKKLWALNEIIYCFDGREGRLSGGCPFCIKQGLRMENVLREINEKKLKKADGSQISFGNIARLRQYLAGYRSCLIQIARTDHGTTGYDRQLSGKIRKIEIIIDYLTKEMEEEADGRRKD